ncbi:hypothetical protein [Haliangium sp.]|uniref:hypothetical protein n=1 Tax=Haliangium sp. TaxID=2663208 RepID=UPI003D0C0C29
MLGESSLGIVALSDMTGNEGPERRCAESKETKELQSLLAERARGHAAAVKEYAATRVALRRANSRIRRLKEENENLKRMLEQERLAAAGLVESVAPVFLLRSKVLK